jgi:hypothetical protein
MSGDTKRRLPLVKELDAAREEDVARPAWQWTIIGAFATWLAWLLLEMSAVPILGAVTSRTVSQPLLVGTHVFVLALAALLGGLFVGRFGVRAGARHAAMTGAIVVIPPWLMLAFRATEIGEAPFLAVLLAALAALATGAAYFGGRLGVRLR